VVLPHITHRFVSVNGLRVFDRDTGPDDATPLLLRDPKAHAIGAIDWRRRISGSVSLKLREIKMPAQTTGSRGADPVEHTAERQGVTTLPERR